MHGVKNINIARSSKNEESNHNYPGFDHCFNVFVYLKRKELNDMKFMAHRFNLINKINIKTLI